MYCALCSLERMGQIVKAVTGILYHFIYRLNNNSKSQLYILLINSMCQLFFLFIGIDFNMTLMFKWEIREREIERA